MPTIHTTAGENKHWVRELSRKLVKLQLPDGEGVNDNASWWENEPVLVTTYAMVALAHYRDMRAAPTLR